MLCKRIVPNHDKERLRAAIERARSSWLTYAPYLDLFRAELRRTEGVSPDQVPDDVITMNSRFAISNPDTGEVVSYTLVYPDQEALHAGRVSVLSPMGSALFGARVGEEVCWHSANGPEVATIELLIYQPELAGDYHL